MVVDKGESTLFRKSALNRVTSADELDLILKVSNPSAWIAVAAFLALFAGLLVWSLVAVVPVRTATTAIVTSDTTAVMWVDADLAEKLRSPDAVVGINDVEASGVTVGTRPMSASEIGHRVGEEYLSEGLQLGAWNYQVDLAFAGRIFESGDETPYLAPVDVVTRLEHPIALVFGA